MRGLRAGLPPASKLLSATAYNASGTQCSIYRGSKPWPSHALTADNDVMACNISLPGQTASHLRGDSHRAWEPGFPLPMRRLSTAESIAGCPSCDSQAHCTAERYNVIQQYAITLPDNSPFLSMPSRKKWILHGQSNDSFGFKYWLGFNVSRGTGEYSPATQHAEARPLPSCCPKRSVLSLRLSCAVKVLHSHDVQHDV